MSGIFFTIIINGLILIPPKFPCKSPKWCLVSIGWVNDLVLSRQQAITWANVDQLFRCHMASLGHNELTGIHLMAISQEMLKISIHATSLKISNLGVQPNFPGPVSWLNKARSYMHQVLHLSWVQAPVPTLARYLCDSNVMPVWSLPLNFATWHNHDQFLILLHCDVSFLSLVSAWHLGFPWHPKQMLVARPVTLCHWSPRLVLLPSSSPWRRRWLAIMLWHRMPRHQTHSCITLCWCGRRLRSYVSLNCLWTRFRMMLQISWWRWEDHYHLGLRPANERCRYKVTTSLIGGVQT